MSFIIQIIEGIGLFFLGVSLFFSFALTGIVINGIWEEIKDNFFKES